MSGTTGLAKVGVLREYFRAVDAGGFPSHLFAEGFQFFFPKYGAGRGEAEFLELARGCATAVTRVVHHMDELLFIEDGNRVAVEGTTEGSDREGTAWYGGQTPGGRFCSIFIFNNAGLIERMYIYVDPDFTGKHEGRFLWPDREQQKW